jgi:peptidoglycan/LPS O-acetylase OafA/YrhL
MGTLRFILAAAVATVHSGCFWDYCVFPAAQAVQLFFMVSGFLMALILNEKYGPQDKWLFYSNRALRIYVPYLFVLAASILAVFPFVHAFGYYPGYAAPLFENAAALDFWTWAFVAFSNLAIFGQDVALWLGFDGHLFLSSQFLPGPVAVHSLQLLRPAWSISLELMFYAIAPFILRRHILILLGIVIACWALQITAYEFGLKGEPWGYRFFVFELSRFMLGALAYRLYALTRHWWIWQKRICVPVTLLVLACVLLQVAAYKPRTLFLFFTVAMPFLFVAGRHLKVDGWLGELSYPIYLIHWPLISIISPIVGTSLPLSLWTIPATIILSVLFVVLIDRPLDRARQERMRARGPVTLPKAESLLGVPLPSTGLSAVVELRRLG